MLYIHNCKDVLNHDSAVLVENDKILAINPDLSIKTKYEQAQAKNELRVIDSKGLVLMLEGG